jgi:hypothetical protein
MSKLESRSEVGFETTQEDPDPFTVVALVVAGVSMFAQLAQLGLQYKQSAGAPTIQANSRQTFEALQRQIENAGKNVERLIRKLNQQTRSRPLESEFRFGAAQAFFGPIEFQSYRELVAQIALDAGQISTWTLTLIQIDPNFAAAIGNQILSNMADVQMRINRIFKDAPTNEAVLEEALFMYKTFLQILDRFDREGN